MYSWIASWINGEEETSLGDRVEEIMQDKEDEGEKKDVHYALLGQEN